LEKLASVQVKSNELSMYGSVKDIGKKENKRKMMRLGESETKTTMIKEDEVGISDDGVVKKRVVNSIVGSNRKRHRPMNGDNNNKDDEVSTDTDDISTDEEIDVASVNRAVEAFKKQKAAAVAESELLKPKFDMDGYKTAEIVLTDEEEEKERVRVSMGQARRKTKYVHVERREEIKVRHLYFGRDG
jgi:hypothetical protein